MLSKEISNEIRENKLMVEVLRLRNLGLSVVPACTPDGHGGCKHHHKCQYPGKVALVGWKELMTRLSTEDEIRLWWTKWPDANIGVVTGKVSGCFVVDIDGSEGFKSLGADIMPSTVRSKTGRDGSGLHHFFRIPKDMEVPSYTRILPGIDIRAEKGIAIVPPSVHLTGRNYQWEIDPFASQIADAPEFVLDWVRNKAKEKTQSKTNEFKENWVSKALLGVSEGERDELGAKLSGYFISKHPSDVALQLLKDWNTKNKPPLQESQVNKIFDSILEEEATKKSGAAVAEIGDLFVSGTELMDQEPEPVKWLIEKLWTEGACGFIGAEPKTGKTWIGMEMAVCIATGKPVLEKFEVYKPGPVLYISEEGKDQKWRLHQIAKQKGLSKTDLSDLKMSILKGFRLDDTEYQKALVDSCTKIRPRAIFLDPFCETHNLNENESTEIKPLLSFLKREIQIKFNCAVLLLHHNRKTKGIDNSVSGQKLRGTGVLYGWLDSALYLEKAKSDRKIIVVHSEHREASEPDPFVFEIEENGEDVQLKFRDEDLDHVKALDMADKIIKLLSKGPALQTELDQKVKGKTKTRYDTLRDLERLGKIYSQSVDLPNKKGRKQKQTMWFLGASIPSQNELPGLDTKPSHDSLLPTSSPLGGKGRESLEGLKKSNGEAREVIQKLKLEGEGQQELEQESDETLFNQENEGIEFPNQENDPSNFYSYSILGTYTRKGGCVERKAFTNNR